MEEQLNNDLIIDYMIAEVKYKGELINKKDIEVTWSDCFGEHRIDSLEDFIRQYTDEQVAKEFAYIICPHCGEHLVNLE